MGFFIVPSCEPKICLFFAQQLKSTQSVLWKGLLYNSFLSIWDTITFLFILLGVEKACTCPPSSSFHSKLSLSSKTTKRLPNNTFTHSRAFSHQPLISFNLSVLFKSNENKIQWRISDIYVSIMVNGTFPFYQKPTLSLIIFNCPASEWTNHFQFCIKPKNIA